VHNGSRCVTLWARSGSTGCHSLRKRSPYRRERHVRCPISIGKFAPDPDVTEEKRKRWIEEISAAPALFRRAVAGLTEKQLDTPYREGGWTIRQVVHHMADSHVHNLVRFRLALTEDNRPSRGTTRRSGPRFRTPRLAQ